MIIEKIKLEEINGKLFEVKIYQNEDEGSALLTHYQKNAHNSTSKYYKQKALDYIKNELKKDYSNEDISEKIAESALQYLLFKLDKKVPFPGPARPKFKFIDLFAGIGGFRLALQNIGGKCIYTSEWDKNAQKTYQTNFGEIPFGDITKKSVKKFIPSEFDILCAGFPCQAFSIAGKREGFEDTRGTLFFDIEQIVEKYRPKVVFLENVKNLVSHDKGKTFKVIIDILENKLKYKVYYKVLNSMTHSNIPQNRERIFLVAFNSDKVKNYKDFEFPSEIPLTKNIHDIIDHDNKEDKYYYTPEHMYYPELDKKMNNRDTLYQWRRVYVRENKSKVCPTLTANMGTGGHNVPLLRDDFGIRKLTPKECFAFQGYPMDKYILPKIANSKLYMQAGNSVTTPLIERIAIEIDKII